MEPNAHPRTTARTTARTRVRRPAPGVKLIKNVMLPMPDGVRLAADVYLPDDGRDELSVAAPMAVVMDYIPYRKDEVNPTAARLYLELPRRGYAAIRVDIRGTGASEGINTDEYTLQEQTDGAAAVEPYLLKWLQHQADGEYWRNGSVGDGSTIRCPVFLIGGWRDGYPNPPLRLFANLRVPKKVLVGPWNHAYPDGAIPGPRIEHLNEVVRWLDHWCKGDENGVMDEPPVVVWMQASEAPIVDRLDSAGEWRAETAWPSPGASERTLRLAAGGRLEEVAERADADPGSGVSTALDELTYHPTVGLTAGLWSGGIQFGLPGDQRPDEALSLTYTSEPLTEEFAILGWPSVRLVVAPGAAVLGFAASLCDVAPDGSSHLIAKGMLNGTRRASLTEPSPLERGNEIALEIRIDCTGWIFAAGHRIRLDIANADFPNVWPTPELAISQVRVGRGGSWLTLPVVPRTGSTRPPAFAPSPLSPALHSAAVKPPIWRVSQDVVTGRTTVHVQVDQAFRVDEDTVIERQFASVCSVDPARPANASAHGWHVNRTIRANQLIEGRCDTVIQSTAESFHVTIDLRITVNGAEHATRCWLESIPRLLL